MRFVCVHASTCSMDMLATRQCVGRSTCWQRASVLDAHARNACGSELAGKEAGQTWTRVGWQTRHACTMADDTWLC